MCVFVWCYPCCGDLNTVTLVNIELLPSEVTETPLSVCLCVCVCVTGRRDLNNSGLQMRLDYLNNVKTIIVFITTGLNFFISTFGMQRTGYFPWLMMRFH
ncbi:ninjurin-2-like isoform X3 [Solea senegalensis]|uniref:Ninjurin-2-like isoform X3 n=1 Tax=Solea senegalensis TaxID=28829 RepID=A0AAV6R134_SOLSE|nr:ninjurin-2-like isoform X3 [Solea senegalensis]